MQTKITQGAQSIFTHVAKLATPIKQVVNQNYSKVLAYFQRLNIIGWILVLVLILALLNNRNILSQVQLNHKVYFRGHHNANEESLRNMVQKRIQKMKFSEFKQKFNKKYKDVSEEVFRSIVFYMNQDKVNHHNQEKSRTFNMVINKFGDLTALQFSQIYTTLIKSTPLVQQLAEKMASFNQQLTVTGSLQNPKEKASLIRQYVHKYSLNKRKFVLNQNSQFQLVNSVLAQRALSIQKKQLQSQTHMHSSFLALKQTQEHQNVLQKQFCPRIGCFSLKTHQINNHTSLQIKPSHQSPFSPLLKQMKYYKTQPLKQIPSSNASLVPNKNATQGNATGGNFSLTPIDWTIYAGQVRFQGVCGACYTFATTDSVGALYSIYKYGFFTALSTQQIIDCSVNGLTYGCNGGFLQGSYAYMQTNGIVTDFDYPYIAQSSGLSGNCAKNNGSFKVSSFKNIEEGNCVELVNQLNYGPVSIGIAGYRLQFYQEGIFNDCNSYIDHAVVLIGYSGGSGWKIKNSWGADWGMNGFAWLADGNNCAICDMAVAVKL